jgi:hypothetical protein
MLDATLAAHLSSMQPLDAATNPAASLLYGQHNGGGGGAADWARGAVDAHRAGSGLGAALGAWTPEQLAAAARQQRAFNTPAM